MELLEREGHRSLYSHCPVGEASLGWCVGGCTGTRGTSRGGTAPLAVIGADGRGRGPVCRLAVSETVGIPRTPGTPVGVEARDDGAPDRRPRSRARRLGRGKTVFGWGAERVVLPRARHTWSDYMTDNISTRIFDLAPGLRTLPNGANAWPDLQERLRIRHQETTRDDALLA